MFGFFSIVGASTKRLAIANSKTERLDIFSVSGTVPTSPMVLPSSDGQGQGTHPDVIDFGTAWNGYRYWMAWTPYTNGQESQENPEICASNDIVNWVVPSGLTNPITAYPTDGSYWADTDLIYDEVNSRLICYYRGFAPPSSTTDAFIQAKHSTDGITWSTPVNVLDDTTVAGVSPSIIKVSSEYEFYDIDTSQSPRKVTKRVSTNPLNFNSLTVTELTTEGIPTGRDLWHINVEVFEGTKYALVTLCDSGQSGLNSNTHMAYIDKNHCVIDPTPMFARQSWYDDNIYRCAMILKSSDADGATFDYYMSGTKSTGEWQIGTFPITMPYEVPNTLTLSATESTTSALSGTDTIGGFGINNNLSKIYFASWGTSGSTTDSNIRQFPLTTTADLSTVGTEGTSYTVQGNQIYNPVFSSDGLIMFYGDSGGIIRRYNLTSAYDLSTASFISSFTPAVDPRALYFSPDGLKFWISEAFTNVIREYTMTSAYDITTATLTKSYSYTNTDAGFTDLTFNDNGTLLVGIDQLGYKVRVLKLSTAYDINTVTKEENFISGSDDYNSISMLGNKIYIYNIQERYIEQKNLA